MQQMIQPVILSGGAGTRLWPVSRAGLPKQFWPLVTERSLLQETALRAVGPDFAPPMVVCNQDHRFLAAEHLRTAEIPAPHIILEPEARNSAPAIAAAALIAAEQDEGQVIWMMAADAFISDVPALHRYLQQAVQAALGGRIVTFGMRPTHPETGYGYIERGPPLAGIPGVFETARFIEKPAPETAARFLEDGSYLWNSGMFVFTAAALIEELATYAPEVLESARRAVRGRSTDADFIRLGPAFSQCPAISLDYAVAERTRHAAVVPADLGWSDVGSWAALWEIAAAGKDESGNVAIGDVLLEDAKNCYVRSDGTLIAVLGLSDVVIVATEDAILAAKRSSAQDVKRLVDRLKSAGRPEALRHEKASREISEVDGPPAQLIMK